MELLLNPEIMKAQLGVVGLTVLTGHHGLGLAQLGFHWLRSFYFVSVRFTVVHGLLTI